MRQAMLTAPRTFEFCDGEKPKPGPGEALVRVGSCGVCGSDVHLYKDAHIGDVAVTEPHILGHEFGGVVEDVGSKDFEFLLGKKIAIEPAMPCMKCEVCLSGNQNCCPDVMFCGLPPTHGGYREYIAFPGALCEPAPDHLTQNQIATLEPLAIAVHVMDLAKPPLGSSAVIFGAGMIGQMFLETAKKFELNPLIVCDRLDYRLEMAKQHGATHTVNIDEGDPIAQIMEITHGLGARFSFEATTTEEGPGMAAAATAAAGKVFLAGIADSDATVVSNSIIRRRGLTLYAIRRSRRTLRRTMGMLAAGRFDVDRVITHEYPLEGLGEAFETVCGYKDGVLKAMIKIGE